jgi:hypothetical protein
MNAIVESHTLAENGNQAISIYTEIESLPDGGFKISIRKMILNKESGKSAHKLLYSKTIGPVA